MAAAGNPPASSASAASTTSPAADRRARLIFLAIWLLWGLALLWARTSYPGLEIGEDWADADILSAARWFDVHGHRDTGFLPRLETAPPPPGEALALYDTYPPGPFWIHETLRAIGITGLAGLRTASQILGHLGVLALYVVFRRLSASPWVALLGASIYMFSAPYASYSSGFWMNLGQPMLALLLLAWLRLEDAGDAPTRRSRLITLCGLAFIDFWITLENAPFLAVFAFVRAMGSSERRRCVMSLGVVLSMPVAALVLRILFNAWAEHTTVAAAIKDLSDTAAERASAQFGGFSWGTLGAIWAARLGWPFNEPGRTAHHTAFVFPALAPVVLAAAVVVLMSARRRLTSDTPERRGLLAGLLLLACGLTWTVLMPNHVYPHRPTVQTVMPGLSLLLGALASAGSRGVFEPRETARRTAIVSAAASLALLGGMFAGLARCDLVNRVWDINTRVHERVTALAADNDRFVRAGPSLARFDRLLVHPKRPTMMYLLGVPSTSSAKEPTRPLLPGEGLVLDVWHPGAARYAAERSADIGLPDVISFPGRMLAFPSDLNVRGRTLNIRAHISGLGDVDAVRIAPTLDPGQIAVTWRLAAASGSGRTFDAAAASRFVIGFELYGADGKRIAKQASRLAWLGTFTDERALIWSTLPESDFHAAQSLRLTVWDTQSNAFALWTIRQDLPANVSLAADGRWVTCDLPNVAPQSAPRPSP